MEPVIRAILSISVIVFAAKLIGELFRTIKMPTVLGELFAGMVFGPYALGSGIQIYGVRLVEFNDIVLAFSEIGAIIILFIAGLELTFARFRAALAPSLVIASCGVIIPFFFGNWIYTLMGFPSQAAVLVGAAMAATSIAVSARTLEGIGKIQTREGLVLINSAAIDDVLALAILAIVISIVKGGSLPTSTEIFATIATALVLWIALLLAGVYIVPVFIEEASLLKIEGSVEASAIATCFGMAALAAAFGLSPIVGAFAAGIAMASSKAIVRIKDFIRHITLIFSPIFFGVIGAAVNPMSFNLGTAIMLAVLVPLAIASKVVGCGTPAGFLLRDKISGIRVGIGMVSRGEVGLIVAGLGLTSGAISGDVYVQIVGMVIATTFLTPILLEKTFTRFKAKYEVTSQAISASE